MLFMVSVVLVGLWLLGLACSCTFGGYIHLLMMAGLAVLIVGFLRGQQG